MKRAALYTRVSTEEQARHGLSLADQLESLKQYAKDHDILVSGIYTDEGISARKRYVKRPALLRLLEDVKSDKIDIILFIKLDRWFRNVSDYYEVQRVLDSHGVSWQATEEDYETVTASGRFKVNIMLSVAQDEADRTSERIKFVFDGKRERREPLTGNCPTGYKIDGKKLIKDPAKESAVSAFFQKFMRCGSISETQSFILEEYGVRIEYQLASKMLDSPVYYGFYYGVDDMAPPYITREEYGRIQSMRNRVQRKTRENRVYLFSGLILCGECRTRMGGRKNTRGLSSFYNCPGHYIKRAGCENKTNLSERIIEQYILDSLECKVQDVKAEIEEISKAEKEKDYTPVIASAKTKLSRLKDLYVNNFIDMDEYRKDRQSLLEKIEELECKQSKCVAPDLTRIERILSEGWRADYESVDRKSKRDFWRLILKEIRIFPDRHIEYDLDI